MAERSHSVHRLRHLPELAEGVSRAVLELLMTTAGIIWLDPRGAPLVIAVAAIAIGLPLPGANGYIGFGMLGPPHPPAARDTNRTGGLAGSAKVTQRRAYP